MDTQAIEVMVSRIEPTVSIDDIGEALGKVKWLKEQAKALDDALSAKVLEYVQANGEIQIGDIRYYAGVKKKTICPDPRAALETMLRLDLDTFSGLLCANPFKHGAAKQALSTEDYSRLFVTVEEGELKEGVPQKRLIATNDKFVKRAEATT